MKTIKQNEINKLIKAGLTVEEIESDIKDLIEDMKAERDMQKQHEILAEINRLRVLKYRIEEKISK